MRGEEGMSGRNSRYEWGWSRWEGIRDEKGLVRGEGKS